MAYKDYYAILNIDPLAGPKTIRSAYRKMALKYHPDHNPGDKQALAQFNRIREAYEILIKPELRRDYDRTYKPQGPVGFDKPDFTTSEKTPRNLRYNLYITLEDVVRGCIRSIRYIRKNKGRRETVQLNVEVPKGAFHHQRLRLAQCGNNNGKNSGDLFVIIHLQDHPLFYKKGIDLRINIPITYLDVTLGRSLEIPTLFGLRPLKLRACDFENLCFTWKGFGLPDPKGGKGDLKVNCFIEHPRKLPLKSRDALQKILKVWPQGEMMKEYQSYLDQLKKR